MGAELMATDEGGYQISHHLSVESGTPCEYEESHFKLKRTPFENVTARLTK